MKLKEKPYAQADTPAANQKTAETAAPEEAAETKDVRQSQELLGWPRRVVFYRVPGRRYSAICPAIVTAYNGDDNVTLLIFDPVAASRAHEVKKVHKGTHEGCWWYSPEELDTAITDDYAGPPSS